MKHDIEVRPNPDLLIEEGFMPPYEERDENFGKVIPPVSVKKKPVSAKYQPSTESKEEDDVEAEINLSR